MNIQIDAAKQELADAVERTKADIEGRHQHEISRLNDTVTNIEAKCLAAIQAAEELAKLGGLDVLERGIAYSGFIEMREDGERYSISRGSTKGYLEVKGIPRGKYKALILLVPEGK